MKDDSKKIKVTRKVDRKGNEFYIIGKTPYKVVRISTKNSSEDVKSISKIFLQEEQYIN